MAASVINTMRGTTLTSWTPYIGLVNGDPRSGGVELTGSGMARIQLTGLSDPAGTGETVNASLLSWPTTSADLGTFTHIGVWDASSGGTLRYATQINLPAGDRLVVAGIPVTLPAGAFLLRVA
jgi:hypothetical protein